MNSAQIVPSIVSAVAVFLLGAIVRMLVGMRRELHGFLAEHAMMKKTAHQHLRGKVVRVFPPKSGTPAD